MDGPSRSTRGGPFLVAFFGSEPPRLVYSIAPSFLSESGGTGRHASLRSLWRKPWGFESLLSHHLTGQALSDDEPGNAQPRPPGRRGPDRGDAALAAAARAPRAARGGRGDP